MSFDKMAKKLMEEMGLGGALDETRLMDCHLAKENGGKISVEHIKDRIKRVDVLIYEINDHPCASGESLQSARELHKNLCSDLKNHELHCYRQSKEVKKDEKSNNFFCKKCNVGLEKGEAHFCASTRDHVLFSDCAKASN